MEALKSISFSITLFLIGALFLLLGLTGGLNIANSNFIIKETVSRIIVSLIGVSFIGLAIFLEIKKTSQNKLQREEKSTEGTLKLKQAETFFYTLDEGKSVSFSNLVQNASRISIVGRTGVNLLSNYQRTFEELGKSGCEIRFLFTDPTSDASRFLYGSFTEIYWNNIKTASSHIRELKRKIGNRFYVKVTQHAPTLSIIIFEKPDASQSFLRVQFYFLHSRIGSDRPMFQINYRDKWYNVFLEEFNQLWINGKEWDYSNIQIPNNQTRG